MVASSPFRLDFDLDLLCGCWYPVMETSNEVTVEELGDKLCSESWQLATIDYDERSTIHLRGGLEGIDVVISTVGAAPDGIQTGM
jgi:hypothetical protein